MACPPNCSCTNQCQTFYPQPCNHAFPYWSVIPPTHCPVCGADLRPKCGGCGRPLPPYKPWTTTTTFTVTTNKTTNSKAKK